MLLRLLFPLVLFTGCVSTYVSPAPVVPLHSKKNDLSGGAVVRPIVPGLGVHAHAAWSPSDEVVLTASSTLTHYESEDHQGRTDATGAVELTESSVGVHKLRVHSKSVQAELGVGRSFAWGMQRLEVMGGGGGGALDMAECPGRVLIITDGFECEWVESRGTFTRAYGQAHYGLQVRVVDLAVGMRISVARYALDELFQQPSERVTWTPVVEPFAMVRFGTGWFKGQVMFVAPITFNTASATLPDLSTPSAVSVEDRTLSRGQLPYAVVGLHINTADMWKGRAR